MFNLILRIIKWAEAELQRIENARIADVAKSQVIIEAHKAAQVVAQTEQAAANKIRGILASLEN